MKKFALSAKSHYLLSLGIVLLASAYPVYMGAQVLSAWFRVGYVDAAEYPKYVIPYAPICIALIAGVASLPLASRLFGKRTLLASSVMAIALFLASEAGFEKITVFSLREGPADVGSWQLLQCMATPEVITALEFRQTIGAGLAERYSPVFKVHFYLISMLMVLGVLGVVHGFGQAVRGGLQEKAKPLALQAISVVAFVGLCILACFTAFYRTGELNVSLLSSFLMSVFFVVFGITAGTYAGGALYGKKAVLSQLVPAAIASISTLAMYLGELVMMGGVLFVFGEGFLFRPLAGIPFALVDLLVILASGLITWGLLHAIRQRDSSPTGTGTAA